jgi:hypothetical protein
MLLHYNDLIRSLRWKFPLFEKAALTVLASEPPQIFEHLYTACHRLGEAKHTIFFTTQIN